MGIVNKEWMPNCSMKRIICHWTAGRHTASTDDRKHYHILVESDGALIRGVHSIADNVTTADGVYAAHTLGLNTGSIGISACCMAGAVERPFEAGVCPMTRKQWETLSHVAAELCQFYRIPVSTTTVLGHGEVEVNCGKPQKGKWDPMLLPWNPTLSRTEVGTMFRAMVQNHIDGPGLEEQVAKVRVVFRGNDLGMVPVANGGALADSREVARLAGWTLERFDEDDATFRIAGSLRSFPALLVDGDSFVDCEEVARELGLQLRWDEATDTIILE
jgi:hypothetical protein